MQNLSFSVQEEIPVQDEATKAVDSTLSHPSATSENIESGAESEKKDASQVYGFGLFFISVFGTCSLCHHSPLPFFTR